MSVSLVQVLGFPILIVNLCSDNLCDFWFESLFFFFFELLFDPL